jgi:hypothetical protein
MDGVDAELLYDGLGWVISLNGQGHLPIARDLVIKRFMQDYDCSEEIARQMVHAEEQW